ncbi:MAG: competence protein CoiA family protein [Candidatus Thiodiazotropha endolucinida]
MSGFNLIPFGYNPTNDTFVDVEDVPRGAKCGCICPACKTPLIARQGEEKEWHFAHASRKVYEKTQKECEFSFYLSVRMMARQIIGNELKITLPEYQDSVSKYIPDLGYPLHEPFVITESKEIYLTNVSVEQNFEGVAVDIVGYISDFKFAIYFTHPGRAIPQELKSPKDRYCGVISIALDNLSSTLFRQAKNKKQSYQSALIEFLSNDISSKQWVFHPRYQRCHQQAMERLDMKAKSLPQRQKQHRRAPRTQKMLGSTDVHLNEPLPEPNRQRVLFECVMCKSQWQGREPGGSVCPKCNTHLYTTSKEILGKDESR